ADLVTSDSNKHVWVQLSNGDGTFGSAHQSTLSVGLQAMADFDGDGKPDAIGWTHTDTNGTDSIYVAYGVGDGTFQGGSQPTLIVNADSSCNPQLVDVNGDGLPDVVTFAHTTMYVNLNNAG